MNKDEYQKLVKKHKAKENRLKNALIAFFVGGSLAVICEIVSNVLVSFGIDKKDSFSFICLGIIFLASLFTCLGFFDEWVKKAKCGLIIPTTGFAHSVASSSLEYKKDGMITGLGANFFKLAGSVILYGIVSAFFLCLLKVIIYG